MKFALVIGGLPFGGATTFCIFVAEGLKSLGIETEVFSFCRENPLADEFEKRGIRVHVEDERRDIFEDRLTNIFEKLRRFEPSAVFSVIGAECFEILRYVPEEILRIGMVHDTLEPIVEMIAHYQKFMDAAVVVCDQLVAMVKACAPSVPTFYLAHGVSIGENLICRDKNETDPLRLIYFGRLEDGNKRVCSFVTIANELHRRDIPFRWTIVGDGPEKQFLLHHLSAHIEAGRVHITGKIDREQLDSIVRRQDIYILASLHEGGPLTLLEAMSVGLVPICTDIPCLIQEIITPENGFRVPVDQPLATVERIALLHTDRTLLEKLSANASATVGRDYSAKAMAQRYVDFVGPRLKPGPVVWPVRICPQKMIGARGWRFSTPGRWIRRVSKYLSSVRAGIFGD